ncbi:unnamed protein product, partial [Symbiodinium microadriaticum]
EEWYDAEEEHEEEYLSEDEVVDPDAVGSGEPAAPEAHPVPTAALHVHPHRAMTSDSVTTAASTTPSPSRLAVVPALSDSPEPSPPSTAPAPSDLQTPPPNSKPSAEVPTPTDEKEPCARRTKQLMLEALNEECELLELLLKKKQKLAVADAGARGSNMDQTETLPMMPAEADEVLQEAKVQVGSFEQRVQQLAYEEPPQVPYFQARTLAMEADAEATEDIPVPLPQPTEKADEPETPCLSPNEAVPPQEVAQEVEEVAPEPRQKVAQEPRKKVAQEPPQKVAQEPREKVAQEPPQKVAQEPREKVAPEPSHAQEPNPSQEVEASLAEADKAKAPISKGLKKRKPKQQPAKEQGATIMPKKNKKKKAPSKEALGDTLDAEVPKTSKGKGKGKKKGAGKHNDPEPKATNNKKQSKEAEEEDEEPQPKATKKKRAKKAREEPQPKTTKKKRAKEAREDDEEPQPKATKKRSKEAKEEGEEPQPEANKKRSTKDAKDEGEEPPSKASKKKSGKEPSQDEILEERRMRNSRKSGAYHSARNAAIKGGLSEAEAKKKAQEVSCMTCYYVMLTLSCHA